ASALKLQPDRLDVLTALVEVEMSQGASDAAVGTSQTALERDPKNVQLLNMLGALYLDRKDFSRAAVLFSRASVLGPALWQPHHNLAALKLAQHDSEGAVGEYRTAVRLAPAEPQLVTAAAELYEKLGRIDEAIAAYEGLYKSNSTARQLAANNLAMLLVTYRN